LLLQLLRLACCRYRLLCIQAVLGGNKGGLFGSLTADFSPAVAAAAMSRLAKMSARVMGDVGFSIGIDDVMPREQLLAEKAATLDKGYGSVQDYIGAVLLHISCFFCAAELFFVVGEEGERKSATCIVTVVILCLLLL
jgi:hypothetical protein